MSADPRARTVAWLEEAVVGLNLCPFAAGPWSAGRVQIVVAEARTLEGAVRAVAAEVDRLVQTPGATLSSTLVVLPHVLEAFDDFVGAIEIVLGLLRDAGAEQLVQLAHFHPAYRFEGTDPDELGNYTNRAPLPTFHLLRHEEVERALTSHGAGLAIPETNIQTLDRLGLSEVSRLWQRFRS